MPDSEYNWDWNRYKPPLPSLTLFGDRLNIPTNKPWGEAPPPNVMPPVMPEQVGPAYPKQVLGVTDNAVTMPSGMPFGSMGNPDARKAEVAAQAVANKPKTYEERLLEALQDKNFMGALATIAKGVGGKAAPTPHPFHMSDARMGPGLPDGRGQGASYMAQGLANMVSPATDLTVPVQRKSARGAQARYDILAQRQKQDLSELYKNLV